MRPVPGSSSFAWVHDDVERGAGLEPGRRRGSLVPHHGCREGGEGALAQLSLVQMLLHRCAQVWCPCVVRRLVESWAESRDDV